MANEHTTRYTYTSTASTYTILENNWRNIFDFLKRVTAYNTYEIYHIVHMINVRIQTRTYYYTHIITWRI